MRGNLLRPLDLANACAAFVTEAADDFDFAELAVTQVFDDFLSGGLGTALSAGLDDFVILARGFDDFSTLPYVVGDRLFHIDIFAGLHCPDRGESMPVVWGRDGNDVDIFIIEETPNVGVRGGSGAPGFVDFVAENFLVGIAERGDSYAVNFAEITDVIAPPPLESDYANADVAIRTSDLGP